MKYKLYDKHGRYKGEIRAEKERDDEPISGLSSWISKYCLVCSKTWKYYKDYSCHFKYSRSLFFMENQWSELSDEKKRELIESGASKELSKIYKEYEQKWKRQRRRGVIGRLKKEDKLKEIISDLDAYQKGQTTDPFHSYDIRYRIIKDNPTSYKDELQIIKKNMPQYIYSGKKGLDFCYTVGDDCVCNKCVSEYLAKAKEEYLAKQKVEREENKIKERFAQNKRNLNLSKVNKLIKEAHSYGIDTTNLSVSEIEQLVSKAKWDKMSLSEKVMGIILVAGFIALVIWIFRLIF